MAVAAFEVAGLFLFGRPGGRPERLPKGTPAEFNLIFKYDGSVLNTFEHTYTKDMVGDPSITIRFELSQSELAQVYQKIYDLDPYDVGQRTSGNGARIPCSYFFLRVQVDSTTKEMSWSDCRGLVNDTLQQLTEYIISVIESKEDYKRLPAPRFFRY